MQTTIFRLIVLSAILIFCSCRSPEFQGGTKWEGIFKLPRGEEKAIAQFDFQNQEGVLSLPGLIPVPLNLTEMSQQSDSVFFTIGFRSGPAPCKALIEGDTMRGIMTSSRGDEINFWLARTGAAQPLYGQTKPPADEPVIVKAFDEKPEEIAVKERLESLLSQYDLEPYLYTKEISIQAGTIPHSHPVLTLNANFEDNDIYLLSTFLHEQMHWYSLSKNYDNEAFGKELMEMYPEVPTDLPEGAGSEMSTYLHLLICYLEYQTLSQVIGEEKAMEHMKFMTTKHYTWVFEKVIEDREKLDKLIRKYDLQFD